MAMCHVPWSTATTTLWNWRTVEPNYVKQPAQRAERLLTTRGRTAAEGGGREKGALYKRSRRFPQQNCSMWELKVGLLVLTLMRIWDLRPCGVAAVTDEKRKMILVLVDGVRWDYLDEGHLPGFEMLTANGVKAEYVVPIMPSSCYPNWYTIVTGLYAEDHGFVSNAIYNEELNDYFSMAPHPNSSHPHWWNHAEPIWITAEKNGKRTSMHWWDGCQVTIRGAEPYQCAPYVSYWSWHNADLDYSYTFQQVLDRIQNGYVDFAMVYYEGVNAHGQRSGPDSQERRRALRNFDSILLDLQKDMKKRNMEDEVNLVVVSDHGMIDIDPQRTTDIDLRSYLVPSEIDAMLGHGSFAMLRPGAGKVDKVYNHLISSSIPGLHVYKKEQLPEHWHLKNTYLTQPLVLVADQRYYMIGLSAKSSSRNAMDPDGVDRGGHGYDPDRVTEMRTIFLARGPGLKKGFVSKPLRQVDHYNLLCYLLGIPPNKNSGRLENVWPMLSASGPPPSAAIVSAIPPCALMLYFTTWHRR